MAKPWSIVPLGEILAKSEEWVYLKPGERYQEVTVRLWGKGVVQRREVTGAEVSSNRRLVVRSGQFILSRIDARNGASGIVPESLDGAIVSNDFPVFILDNSRILPSFLGWMSKTREFVDLCKTTSEGTTNRVRMKEDRFLATGIPFPPLPEQQRIVTRIEELAAKIKEAQELQNETTKLRRQILLSVYAKMIKDAEYLPMAEVAPLKRRQVRVNLSDEYHELGIRSFGKGTFHKPAVNGAALGTKKIFRIEADDLLFNIVFAWEGAVAVAKQEDHGRVGSHRFLTCVPKEGITTSSFLCFHFLTESGLEQLGEASPGGAGRNRTLGLKALERIQVPIPPLEKQVWFDALQKKLEGINRLQAETAIELDAMVPSILDKAFKGKL